MITLKKLKHQNKAEFKNLDDSEVLSNDFSGLRLSAASLTSPASATSMASTASKALFHQRTSWFWWLYHAWHQKDQYCPLFVEWIIKNPNFHWYPISFLLEAVETSPYYYFENQVYISKIPDLRIPKLLSNKILLAYFYLSEPIHNVQFNVRYPVDQQGCRSAGL